MKKIFLFLAIAGLLGMASCGDEDTTSWGKTQVFCPFNLKLDSGDQVQIQPGLYYSRVDLSTRFGTQTPSHPGNIAGNYATLRLATNPDDLKSSLSTARTYGFDFNEVDDVEGLYSQAWNQFYRGLTRKPLFFQLHGQPWQIAVRVGTPPDLDTSGGVTGAILNAEGKCLAQFEASSNPEVSLKAFSGCMDLRTEQDIQEQLGKAIELACTPEKRGF